MSDSIGEGTLADATAEAEEARTSMFKAGPEEAAIAALEGGAKARAGPATGTDARAGLEGARSPSKTTGVELDPLAAAEGALRVSDPPAFSAPAGCSQRSVELSFALDLMNRSVTAILRS